MGIKPESIIEAFQKSEKFSCGARTIDFYAKLGFPEKDIRKTFEKGGVAVTYGGDEYLIGLTNDGKEEYVTIAPKISVCLSLQIIKLGKELKKQGRI